MRRGNIQLQNTDRSHCRYISTREADELVRLKRAVRVSARANRTAVRLVTLAKPSESNASPCSFTCAEMLAFVGLGSNAAIFAARRKAPLFKPTIRCAHSVAA